MSDDDFEAPSEYTRTQLIKNGRYSLPVPGGAPDVHTSWTRATTLAKALSDEYTLNEWKLRQVVFGIGRRPDLQALAASATEDDYRTLKDVARQAEHAAESLRGANIGTAVHGLAARVDAGGQDFAATGPLSPYVVAYRSALAGAGVELLPGASERVCVLRPEAMGGEPGVAEGVAGRLDRVVLLPDGSLPVLDLKTAKGSSLPYAWLEISIQLAIYAHAREWWDESESRYVPAPEIRRDLAIVAHIPQDVPADRAVCHLYPVDIEAGWRYLLLAMRVREARRVARRLPMPGLSIPPRDGLAGMVTRATSACELSALWRDNQDAWTDGLTALGKARLSEINGSVTA